LGTSRLAKLIDSRGDRIEAPDLVRGDEFCAQSASNERRAHFSTTDDTEVHRPSITGFFDQASVIFAWMMKKSSHRRAMRNIVMMGFLGMCAWGAEETPPVEDMFLPNLKSAQKVMLSPVPSGISMAISSSSEEAQQHVLQGLNLIHGGWDFEAYRHFTEALKLDPDCLMAHFGVTFCMLETDADYLKARMAAAERALALIAEGIGTELERGYIYAMAKLLDEGPASAANTFGLVAKKFPQDRQLKLFEAYFRRSGFDDYGSPKPEQEAAQEILKSLMKTQPDSPLLMHSWLMIRAENLQMGDDLLMARKLCQLVPDYPPYLHLLGHYEWRCGNHREAATAFSRSGDLYVAWMKNSGIGIADCPEWIRAEVYRAVALASSGDYDSALAVAKAIVKVPIPPDRMKSPGARMMWWEAYTLESRLLLRRGRPGDVALAKASMPKMAIVNAMTPVSKVAFLYQGLAMLWDGKTALAEKNVKRVEDMQQALSMHVQLMDPVRRDAAKLGEISHYVRAYTFMEIANLEFKGDVAMSKADPKSTTAYNWYSGARERQLLSSRMMPPICLLPMSVPLGRYYESKSNYERAKEMYDEGLQYWPRDLSLLQAMKQLQITTKDEAGAAATEALIREVVGEK
jgi:tetratricopeptide (TPR) repeat protein